MLNASWDGRRHFENLEMNFLQNPYLRIILKKRAARIILRCDILTPSENMFNELQWLSFPKRVQYHTIAMMHKALNGHPPAYISNMLLKYPIFTTDACALQITMSFESPFLKHGPMKTRFL